MFIVALGDIMEGHTFHGPFQSWDEAWAWADARMETAWVIELESPQSEDAP